ncbi:MAG TPA: alkaline phosphatase PhoX [Glycomyces sp.]|nr:alkaline phosphatase PhoX [Glycomyces sp.]
MSTRTSGAARPKTPSRRAFRRRPPSAGEGRFAVPAMEGMTVRAASAIEEGRDRAAQRNGGYGEPRELTRTDPRTGLAQTLWLPEGFDFQVLSPAGSRMDDGAAVPLGHDAMACFAAGEPGVWHLVRNHEERSGPGAAAPSGRAEGRYDPLGGGGTTTMRLRWERGAPVLEGAWQSLAGTIANCAGGPTPWGSWLSCEETTAGAGAGWGAEHGYVFEVPSGAAREADPVPLRAMGRFVHEAVAVDPGTGVVYETEDQHTAGFYRFLPETPGALAEGGRLQMLKVKGEWNYDTRTGQRTKKALPVEWVDIADPDPADAERVPLAVFNQGWARGAAVFGRLEGCWWGGGAVYLASSSGGEESAGQVWEYAPGSGSLRLVFESPDAELLSSPDGIAVSPGGNLLLCENARRGLPAVRGLTRAGEVFTFAHHEGGAEWRGATFSPGGEVLFVNLQGATAGDPALQPGRTIAVWGPWDRGVL